MASLYTKAANSAFRNVYDLTYEGDYKDSFEGFYADMKGELNKETIPELMSHYPTVEQINKDCPDTVNPSYFKQNHLDDCEGVFEVIPKKIYQVRPRSIDYANFTVVRGKTGWVIVDCMSSVYSCKTCFDLIQNTVEKLKVSAIIVTHSHGDHYMGYDAVGYDTVPLYLPDNFKQMCFDENVCTVEVMGRRSEYQCGVYNKSPNMVGSCLAPSRLPKVDGKSGSYPHSQNTTYIKENCTLEVDGLQVDFIPTPDTEAPANMMCYFKDYETLSAADNMLHFLHNLVTLRGAKVRSGKLWSKCIDDAIVKYGKTVQHHFGGHDWHLNGNEKINHYWVVQRDMFKYQHDQALRYANKGYTPNEIADVVQFPKSLATEHCCRGFYGNLKNNVKSQYMMYLGWYDNNVAHLNELPPKEISLKYVEACGGIEKALAVGQKAYDCGEYRWASTILNYVVFADKTNQKARNLLADVYDQLAYQCESALWVNSYNTAAIELRNLDWKQPRPKGVPFNEYPISAFCDLMCVSVDPKVLGNMFETVKVVYKDTKEERNLVVSNGTLHVRECNIDDTFTASIEGNRKDVCELLQKNLTFDDAMKDTNFKFTGVEIVKKLLEALDFSVKYYNFVEPQ
ncbi:alkyl/aryl-sulfatase BDS1, putative [Entamoeba invadens IP1]|uniref:Alkyl/aryl-sulfatase BDS1, putative n=1 Tax=Entamoeba invadens IP1 TaxID=370355 RepID=A0A0A1TZZ7_ENTIV|nr:alkyl/aryl-sulfatase BDS1, putative [Entamoeba invadens IP1]ELP87220.1 alkyl/aryl-sulfatase BDS1, putative [Entamoeba invadens IP1]|eukprot:XP_004253991.1 alkyl/aryl-sulfatase BDS1, putative [Entamoeba invadens IP1]